eukprot:7377156-Prymnesium_polylepis.1
MKASRFAASFLGELDKWEKALSHISETIEMMMGVQRKWMYLESIFVGSEDIRKQLPQESSLFDEAIVATVAHPPLPLARPLASQFLVDPYDQGDARRADGVSCLHNPRRARAARRDGRQARQDPEIARRVSRDEASGVSALLLPFKVRRPVALELTLLMCSHWAHVRCTARADFASFEPPQRRPARDPRAGARSRRRAAARAKVLRGGQVARDEGGGGPQAPRGHRPQLPREGVHPARQQRHLPRRGGGVAARRRGCHDLDPHAAALPLLWRHEEDKARKVDSRLGGADDPHLWPGRVDGRVHQGAARHVRGAEERDAAGEEEAGLHADQAVRHGARQHGQARPQEDRRDCDGRGALARHHRPDGEAAVRVRQCKR